MRKNKRIRNLILQPVRCFYNELQDVVLYGTVDLELMVATKSMSRRRTLRSLLRAEKPFAAVRALGPTRYGTGLASEA